MDLAASLLLCWLLWGSTALVALALPFLTFALSHSMSIPRRLSGTEKEKGNSKRRWASFSNPLKIQSSEDLTHAWSHSSSLREEREETLCT